MGARVAWVISSLHQILIYLCQMLIGLHLFTPVVTLLNIVLYRRTGIAQDPEFVTISLDKGKGIFLAAMSVFNITLLFPNIIGMPSFCNFVCVADRMILNFLIQLLVMCHFFLGSLNHMVYSRKYEILIARHFCHMNFSFYK